MELVSDPKPFAADLARAQEAVARLYQECQRERPSSPEHRAIPRTKPDDPAEWLIEYFNGLPTTAGVQVSERTALTFSAFFACVRILAESTASLPYFLHRRLKPRGKERAEDHDLFYLAEEPNREMDGYMLRETSAFHLATWGNSYCEIERDNAYRPIGLWPLPPDKVTVRRVDQEIVYDLNWQGTTHRLRRDQVLHIAGLSYNGLVGMSPVGVAREAIGLGLAAEQFGSGFFARDCSSGIVLTYPHKLDDKSKDRIRQSFTLAREGLSNVHRTALLEYGVQIEKVGIPPEDAQFLQTRRFQIEDMARIFRIPPHMLADLERMTFNNVEELGIEFVCWTLLPWMRRIEAAWKRQLLSDTDRREYFWEHNPAGFLRGDIEKRYKAYQTGRQNGFLHRDHIHELENINPTDDGHGEDYWQPLNMVALGGGGETEEQERERLDRFTDLIVLRLIERGKLQAEADDGTREEKPGGNGRGVPPGRSRIQS